MTRAISKFERKVFATSRLAEFCSESELEKQTGHTSDQWPLVVLKELVDNAADEAEKSGIAPVIDITVAKGEIIVTDHGSGIAAPTVERILDFSVRVSDKEAYVSPTRGAQGNALKTIIAMPFVLDGERGETIVEAQSIRHMIIFETDPIRREPKVTHRVVHGTVKNGTRITVRWPDSACSQLRAAKPRFLSFAAEFAIINPHLTMRVTWDGKPLINIKALDPAWTKWSRSDPIPVHWYTQDRFERLIAAHIANDQDVGGETTVRDFVASFRGLSATAKQSTILDEIGAHRLTLARFYNNGRNRDAVKRLRRAMFGLSNPVKPKDLGVIGRHHLEGRFREAGAEMESFKYSTMSGTSNYLPWMVEVAFAWRGPTKTPDERRLITGVNFSPTIINPFRHVGDGQSLDSVLADQWASYDEPVMSFVHLVCPRLSFTDRGKTALVLGDVSSADADNGLSRNPLTPSQARSARPSEPLSRRSPALGPKRARRRSATTAPGCAGTSV
jgi:DNA topoisomerase VI subunit B